MDDDGGIVALVCPDCLTATEVRLRDEDTQDLLQRIKENWDQE